MKAKLQSIKDGKLTNHRGFVDAETWIGRRIDFLTDVYKFDSFDLDKTDDVITLRCHRDSGKPGTRGGAMDITFILTIID